MIVLFTQVETRQYFVSEVVDVEQDCGRLAGLSRVAATSLGVAAAHMTVMVAVDLREDWPAALTKAGWQQGLPTLWLAEGLWYALPAEGADDLLRRISARFAPYSLLAFDQMQDSDLLRAARAALSPEPVELWRGGPTERPDAWHGWDASVHDLREVAADYHRCVSTELTGAPTAASRAWLATATVQGVRAL
jgi:methyltransferase (TIGR00027 family)